MNSDEEEGDRPQGMGTVTRFSTKNWGGRWREKGGDFWTQPSECDVSDIQAFVKFLPVFNWWFVFS